MSTLESVQFEESLSFDENKKRLLFGGIHYIEVLVKVGGWGLSTVLLFFYFSKVINIIVKNYKI